MSEAHKPGTKTPKMRSTLPKRDLLPDWVRWLAQDANGAWWGFEVEPLQADHCWYENEVGRSLKLETKHANAQWRNTLQRR